MTIEQIAEREIPIYKEDCRLTRMKKEWQRDKKVNELKEKLYLFYMAGGIINKN